MPSVMRSAGDNRATLKSNLLQLGAVFVYRPWWSGARTPSAKRLPEPPKTELSYDTPAIKHEI